MKEELRRKSKGRIEEGCRKGADEDMNGRNRRSEEGK